VKLQIVLPISKSLVKNIAGELFCNRCHQAMVFISGGIDAPFNVIAN